MNDVDIAYQKLEEIIQKFDGKLNEADTRDKIIDPIFEECLGWSKDDIRKETHVNSGYIDYCFYLEGYPVFVVEAKKTGIVFDIPISFSGGPYIIGGTIWDILTVRNAILQARQYAIDIGAKIGIITNGYQFLIFEAFRDGPWKEGNCIIFHSFEDIQKHFPRFWNILNKNSVRNNSLQKYLVEQKIALNYEKPLEFFNYKDLVVPQNQLASILVPFINVIFDEIIGENQIEILKECYVTQKYHNEAKDRILNRFVEPSSYFEKFGIERITHTDRKNGKFTLSFEKCEEFLRRDAPTGSIILLLGRIGSGKTTFINHFFKVTLLDRKNVIYFYIDFRYSSPDIEKIEDYIYKCIVENYESRYESQLRNILKEYDLVTINPNYKDILQFFTLLKLYGYTISLILDNVDQHILKSLEYQERAFLICQNLTKTLKTVTILTLREESFFKSNRSGVFNAFNMVANTFHISSPSFEEIIRKRLNYVLNMLELNDDELIKKFNLSYSSLEFKQLAKIYFTIINRSVSSGRKVGKNILKFIDDMSGNNIRQGLGFFTTFLISGNTEIQEMLQKEIQDNPDGKIKYGYIIPFHHFIKSIILEDSQYYSMEQNNIMNIYDISPEYTDSHFIHLRVLDYLNKRKIYNTIYGSGYINISHILIDSISSNHSQKAIEESIKLLARYGLIEFENQSPEGYDSASFVRITKKGFSYINFLVNKFVYLDLIWGDTPISDVECITKLRQRINVEKYDDDIIRTNKRFERTDIFLDYLKKSEQFEWNNYPALQFSQLCNKNFIDEIIKIYTEEKKYILERMEKRYKSIL